MLTTLKRVAGAFLPLLAVVLLVWGTGCRPEGARALEQGERLRQQGRPAEAIALLSQAATLLRTNAQAWNRLGLACHAAGQSTNAFKAYRQALSLARERDLATLAEVRFNLGCLYLEQGDLRAAEAELAAFTLLQPKVPDGWVRLASVQLRSRQLDAAERSYAQALSLDRRSVEALNGVGVLLMQKRRPRDAYAYFVAALQVRPQDPTALLNLAIVAHQHLNLRPFALQKYREYLALEPRPSQWAMVDTLASQLDAELHPAPPPVLATVPPPVTNAIPTNAVAAVAASLTNLLTEVGVRSTAAPSPAIPAPPPPPIVPPVVAAAEFPQPAPETVALDTPAPKPPMTTAVTSAGGRTEPLSGGTVSGPGRSSTEPTSVIGAGGAGGRPPEVAVVTPTPGVTAVPAGSERMGTALEEVVLPEAPEPKVGAALPPPEPAPASPPRTPEPAAASVAALPTNAALVQVEPPPPPEMTSPIALPPPEPEKKPGFFSRLNPVRWFGGGKEDEAKASRTSIPLPTTPATNDPRLQITRSAPATPPRAVVAPVVTPSVTAATPPPDAAASLAAPSPSRAASRDIPRYERLAPLPPQPGDRAAAEAHFRTALAAHQRSRWREAMSEYRQAVTADPSFYEAQYNLALAALNAGDIPRALVASEMALAIQDLPAGRYHFGLVLQRAGFPLDAVDELDAVLQEEPTNAEAHFLLGNVYAQDLAEPAKARPHYLKVLELAPNHAQAVAIRYWLTQQGP